MLSFQLNWNSVTQTISFGMISVTVSEICDALGRREIAIRIGRGVTAVSNAASQGKFPAAWYVVLTEMCAEQGIDCPLTLFRFLGDEDAA